MVGVPVPALPNVRPRELPVFLRLFDASEKSSPLSILRKVEEELDDVDSVVRQIPLKVVDLAEAALP